MLVESYILGNLDAFRAIRSAWCSDSAVNATYRRGSVFSGTFATGVVVGAGNVFGAYF